MQRSTRKHSEVLSIKQLEQQQDLQAKQAISRNRQEATLARRMREAYRMSSAQYFMRFEDFQKPGRRNRILEEYGQQRLDLPFDAPKVRKQVRSFLR